MKNLLQKGYVKACIAVSAQLILTASLVMAVEPSNSKTFAAGEKAKVKGVILSRDGSALKVRGDDDTINTVDVTSSTKIELKKGWMSHSTMEPNALVPGLHIEAQGKGSDNGDLAAEKVIFDPNSMKASRQIDARVSPLEARTNGIEGRAGQLEGRAGQLENRAGQIEGRQTELEGAQKQTIAQLGQVKSTAEQANQGVSEANNRIGNLDNYTPQQTVAVYFRSGSAVLTQQAKTDLDNIATQSKNAKGYVLEVTGFADTTGKIALNQELSQRRAQAVIQYLEEQGDIPVHRILPATGLGTTHEAGDNKTSAGRKLNRRVEVKMLVNQGLVSQNGGATGANPSPASTGTNSSTPPPSTTTPPQQ
jgi:OmpA-OmpF porin, OOP family